MLQRLRQLLRLDQRPAQRVRLPVNIDMTLVLIILVLLSIGFIMVTSASMVTAADTYGSPYYFMVRQGIYIILGIMAMGFAMLIPTDNYEKLGIVWLILAIVLLIAVLIPGIGRMANGSRRWIGMGFFNIQVSELVKLLGIMYFASYLVRYGDIARYTFRGVFTPIVLLGILAVLLLMEPDFGATVVLFTVVLGMMFLDGVALRWFALLIALGLSAVAALIIKSPYRVERLTAFLYPWANQYDSGYQLTQSLIAFGRGHWLGLGLGESVQKLYFLPEAHTDFIVAILAEEFGVLGLLALMVFYGVLVWRGMRIGCQAWELGRPFACYVAFGILFWIAFQVVVNIGVNIGALPTKGLTLPLISYGGSSLLIMCFILGILLRIDFENKVVLDLNKPKFVRRRR